MRIIIALLLTLLSTAKAIPQETFSAFLNSLPAVSGFLSSGNKLYVQQSGASRALVWNTSVGSISPACVVFHPSGALGCNTGFEYDGLGTITLSGGVSLPTTTSASVGTINIGGTPILHAFGNSNIFIGGAGNFATTGQNNFAGGASSQFGNLDANFNVSAGSLSLGANQHSQKNVAIGVGSLAAFNNGSVLGNNTALGTDSGYTITGAGGFGYANICVGQVSCGGITTGITNTIISTGLDGLPSNLIGAVIIAAGAVVKIDYNYTAAASWTLQGGLALPGIATSGTAQGSLCITSAGVVYIKTTSGACL